MAFPTTSVLDSFTRADESPIAGNWSNDTYARGSGNGVVLTSNQILAAVASSGTDQAAWWSAAPFGPDCEAFVEMAVKPSSSEYLGVELRIDSPGTGGIDGYGIYFINDTIEIYRITNALFLQNGAAISQAFSSGDSLGVNMVGDTINVYRKTGGSWGTSLGTRTDSTFTAAGFIGVYFLTPGAITVRADNFGGGTVAVGPALIGLFDPSLRPEAWFDTSVV